MALINTEIKPFKAQAFKQGDFIEVTDADIKGKWAVFFFYPADFTFVCPTELGDLADVYDEFTSRDVEIYSVSTDTHFSHKAWHDSSETINKIQCFTGSTKVNSSIIVRSKGWKSCRKIFWSSNPYKQ